MFALSIALLHLFVGWFWLGDLILDNIRITVEGHILALNFILWLLAIFLLIASYNLFLLRRINTFFGSILLVQLCHFNINLESVIEFIFTLEFFSLFIIDWLLLFDLFFYLCDNFKLLVLFSDNLVEFLSILRLLKEWFSKDFLNFLLHFELLEILLERVI